MTVEGEWRRCRGMNSTSGRCRNLLRHKRHKRINGVWYWQVR